MTGNRCFVDIETRSTCDLKTHGARHYIAHPQTQLVSLVALTADRCYVWVNRHCFAAKYRPAFEALPIPTDYGHVPPLQIDYTADVPSWLRTLAASHQFVGHNATGFDAPFLSQRLGVNADWFDTLPAARAFGLPGKLDMIGEKLLGVGKHEGGKTLAKFYKRDGDAPGHLLQSMLAYNVCDCLITRALFSELSDYLDGLEVDLLKLHDRINERGVRLDVGLASKLQNIGLTLSQQAGETVERLTDGALRANELRSVPKVKAWLKDQGFIVDNIRRETLGRLMADPEEFYQPGDVDETPPDVGSVSPLVIDVLRARAAATRIVTAKLDAASAVVGADGRLRDMLVYHGAHTGRFTSRVVQLHNLTRGHKDLDVARVLGATDLEQAIRDEATRLRIRPDDVVSALLRPVLIASDGTSLLQVDYAAIEARGLAWIAGQEDLLDAFSTGRDVYCEFGSKLYGRQISKADKNERQISKVVVLGCGYGMGDANFALYAANSRLDLTQSGLTPTQCVEAYRDAYPKIAGVVVPSKSAFTIRRGGVWRDLQDACFNAVQHPGEVFDVARCRVGMYREHLLIQLPSQRELIYRDAALEDLPPRWGGDPRPTLTYWSGKTATRRVLYGGAIVENAVQAICRDLLCEALLRLDRAGFKIVLHVHDEIVCEGDDLERMVRIMEQPPTWAGGFPILAEGKKSQRYGTDGLTLR